ncbi:hypothetical protein B0T19DRAFT_445481 [Cercophora scortea]|uniref:Uncharacterized protein n=1 Tax=Cercophora scortea TaxID=314031 RepID=A0AAE0I7F3_9PEZI|nr:hypothetical protein B0T19DRAFT_445481 [Cercophora scortea]
MSPKASPEQATNDSPIVIFAGANRFDRADRTRVMQHAMAAADYESTPQDIRLAFFVAHKFGLMHERSGCAVIFKRWAPGTADHGSEISLAWCLDPVLDTNLGETIAIAQGAEVALRELETIERLLSGSPDADRRVTVQIFSSSLTALKGVNGVRINTQLGYLFDRILHVIKEKSDSIRAVGSLNPVLEFRFVPARRTGVAGFWRQPKAMLLSREPKRTGKTFMLVGRKRGRIDPMYTNVFDTIKPSFIASKPPLREPSPEANVDIWPADFFLYDTPPEASPAEGQPADGDIMNPGFIITQVPSSGTESSSSRLSEASTSVDEPAYLEFIFRLP